MGISDLNPTTQDLFADLWIELREGVVMRKHVYQVQPEPSNTATNPSIKVKRWMRIMVLRARCGLKRYAFKSSLAQLRENYRRHDESLNRLSDQAADSRPLSKAASLRYLDAC